MDTGEYISPDPYEDHPRNFQIAQTYYNQGKLNGLDDARMELLRRYMDDNDRFMKLAAEAAQAPPAPPTAPMEGEALPPEMMQGPLPETALLEQPMM
jgi:hypothetical protein